MKDRQDMTDEEHRAQDARESAARDYLAAGFADFAEQVERGQHDDCQQMRVARFFVDPPQPHDPEFIRAWAALSTTS